MHKSIFIFFFIGFLCFEFSFGIGSNLDFEQHTCNGTSTCVFVAGSTNLTDWNIEQDITLVTKSYWKAQHENASILLQTASGPGSVSQYISTKVGSDYKITFQLAGSQASQTYTLELLVGSGNATNYNYTSKWLQGWTEKSYSFTATGETTLVRFTSLNSGANGPAIDNIKITEVKPEEVVEELNLDVQIGIVVVTGVFILGGALLRSL